MMTVDTAGRWTIYFSGIDGDAGRQNFSCAVDVH